MTLALVRAESRFGSRVRHTPEQCPARHDKMVELVERMLDLHKQLPKAKTPHEQESLKRTFAATDAQIDALVYELYGLTEKETSVVDERC